LKEYSIRTFEKFITDVRSLSTYFNNPFLWWRGQADSTWTLSPGVFRNRKEIFESSLNFDFMMKAKSRFPNCPTTNSNPSWLLLMQHYGLPTRLLDWTESPLIALYFAVENEKEDEKDAVVYALQPFNLNSKQCDMNAILSPGHSEIRPIFNDAFNINKTNSDQRIAAFQTEQFDIRHLVQQSEFTIHGSATAIEDLPKNEEFLGKIIISASAKGELRKMLKILGITRSYLFPDLENLSAELTSLYRVE
jgi:hypothetical protein